MSLITSVEQLEALYGLPGEASVVKELDHVIPEYAAFIEASPFVALATCGPEGLDCSPRGDLAGFVRLLDEKTLMMPDRRGNNRADSLKNIIRDPRVGLLFLVPGSGTTLRVNGRAHITADAELCASFMVDGKPAGSVTVVAVDAVYFQCARAIVRSELWNPAKHVDPKSLPTPGQILEITSRRNINGAAYDKEWPERAKKTMW
ncbi:pyridoxamine 5'-phosphate oxidase family protein [Mesorhizobium sp. M1A.F.Ca.IN.020.06.1.1]|uniref:pyridoxamine 5'-phosphate oxidase family protein n=1 Tax=unclassified Mesorhizobium TaxID=325217 RepID=UPI000BAF5E53|nr:MULTISPECIES: pyridoxamine 5'-phosphate oxidase family protein [unclassified Mesorhizobium]PBB30679.1 flavin-nucleotide-binding protein [Mesorhizobium sp. WSM3882]RUU96045.1 pyridoxamine 5'-phosphate oxidase family protein [Mesorhizobium sp. M1A.F.Ca.IN.020.03.2.1]RUV87631.1 pyridoxamine 5'-phosphate oxidase family protein [Mesorhizobium sp. M1A.F.Ca.IN.020.32.1.1]RUW10261.1 pyridoxamine 5'-phosphate oxidase family protein [Mesorhizobium sp. M1A.F.Ca.IN.022.05.2.1]RUW17645.1 pyridoxamine 5'